MSKHTQGPWYVVKTETGKVYVRNEGGLISEGPRPFSYDKQFERYCQECEEYEANAHLIAAAPDLLGALKLMADAVELEMKVFGEEPEQGSRLKIAQAAIAKATGGAA